MKKRFIYYACMFAILLACSKEFTEKPAIGALSDEAIKNEQGVELLLVGAYSALDGIRNNQGASDWTVSGDNWWFDVIADDAHKGSEDGDQPDLFAIEIYNWSTANPYFFGRWNALYAGVNRANAVLDLVSKIEEGDFTAQIAEARFLRGHYNMELVKIYGNVPYISEENFAAVEFNQPNPGPIWDEIEADFQFAIDNLPSTPGDPGKPTILTAQAFKGKAHMFQQEFAEAKTLFDAVIGSGTYSLLPEFLDNFSLAGDNSTESIFAIQFTTDGGQSLNGNRGGTLNFPNPGPFASCCGFYQPSQDLANAYQTDGSGLPLLDTFNQTDIANDYGVTSEEAFTPHAGNLDPRIDYTIGRRGIDYNGYGPHIGSDWIRAGFGDISGPYLPKKNVYQAGEDGNVGTGAWGQQHSGINYHIMRYADLLLMRAEIAVEESDLATALSIVNQIRARARDMSYVQNEAGTGDAANYVIDEYASFADQDEARKAVRFERRLELA
ncbi:MAG: RagB/SusD family nutrient uptake outer membrane protein, partial [Flavobacteriaceae bacterium]